MTDELTGDSFEVKATKVVNAGGPWVDQIRLKDKNGKGRKLHLTKGVHIVVPHSKLPVSQALYFDVPDGRMVFAIPRDGITYIGTTDTDYHENPDYPICTKADAEYLLKAANGMFKTPDLQLGDLVSTWAGLRPLIQQEGKGPGELSRKDEIFFSDSGLITIAGGKLTGYRKMAQRVVDICVREMNRRLPKCRTDTINLSGGNIEPRKVEDFCRVKFEEVSNLLTGLTITEVRSLFNRYGTNLNWVLGGAAKQNSPAMTLSQKLLAAELDYCLHFEMVAKPSDFFIRRTGKLFFNRAEVLEEASLVLNLMSEVLAWDQAEADANKKELKEALDETLAFLKE